MSDVSRETSHFWCVYRFLSVVSRETRPFNRFSLDINVSPPSAGRKSNNCRTNMRKTVDISQKKWYNIGKKSSNNVKERHKVATRNIGYIKKVHSIECTFLNTLVESEFSDYSDWQSLSSFMAILKFPKTPFLTARQALQQIATMAQMLTTYAG